MFLNLKIIKDLGFDSFKKVTKIIKKMDFRLDCIIKLRLWFEHWCFNLIFIN